jgi:hypothetical protein
MQLALRFRVAAAAGLLALLAAPARAGVDPEKVIPGLYGGDGITLGNPSHDAHFNSSTFEQLNLLNSALQQIPGNLPIGSSAAAFTYEFNPATGVPERRMEEGLGPLYAERARTLGGGVFGGDLRMSIAFQYSHIDFTHFEGDNLKDLKIIARHDDVPGDNAFENDVILIDLNLHASEDIFTLYLTLGLTEWLDFAMVMPFVYVDVSARAHATIIDRGGNGIHFFDPTPGRIVTPGGRPTDAPDSSGAGSAFGLADTFYRLKWRFLDLFKNSEGQAPLSKWMEFALLAQLKLPTGDPNDLRGTNEIDYRLVLVASKTFEGWFEPHFNFGYEWNGVTARRDAYVFAAGISLKAADELTFFADVVGKKERIGEGIGENLIDIALGLKWNPLGNLIITPGFLVPLNEEGLRPDFIPSIALEYVF